MNRSITDKEIAKRYKDLLDIVNTIKNKDLKEVAQEILEDNKEEYCNRAGSSDYFKEEVYKQMDHHFFKGGLLYHTLGVTRLSLVIAEQYNFEGIDRDLLIFGAALHDIGKIEIYDRWKEEGPLKSQKRLENTMLKHTYLGVHKVHKYLDSRDDIDEILKQQALHMIATHMGKEAGAFGEPCMLEAIIIAKADNIDAMLDKRTYEMAHSKEDYFYDEKLKRTLYKSVNKLN